MDTARTPAQPGGAAPDHRRGLRLDIEGLRAFAVLAVLAYHLGAPLTGGFAGVDVFFVISGFLITSHLLKELQATGNVRLWRFYARRAKRLLPPATLVLLLTLVGGYFILSTTQFRTLINDVMAATVYVVNWALAGRAVDYLAEDVEPSAVQHYWSLSVEEQFYIVVPILLILIALVARRTRLRAAALATLALAVIVLASFVTSLLLTASDPAQAYFVTWTRAWEMGVGSLLACALVPLSKMPQRFAQRLAGLGLVLMIASVLFIDSTTPWPGSAALLPVAGTAMVLAAGVAWPRTAVGRVLGLKPLVWIGGLSYSLYLWHWPLVVFAEILIPDRPNVRMLVVLVLSFALAYLGKRFVEDPIRFGSITATTPRALLVGVVAMALVIVSSLGVRTTLPTLGERPATAEGAVVAGEGRIEERMLSVEQLLRTAGSKDEDAEPAPEPESTTTVEPEPTDASTEGGGDGEQTLPPVEENSVGLIAVAASEQMEISSSGEVVPDPGVATEDVGANYSNGCHQAEDVTEPVLECVFGDPEGEYVVAAIGDSKLGQWYEPLVQIAEEEGWRLEFYVKSACSFVAAEFQAYPECKQYNERLTEILLEDPERVDAVITSAGGPPAMNSDNAQAYFADMWVPLRDAGIDIYAIADNPPPQGEGQVYECVEENRDDFSGCAFTKTMARSTSAMLLAREIVPEATVIDLADVICPTEDECPAVVGGVLAYRQGSHLTTTFVETLTPYLREGLQAAGMPIE